MTEKPNLVLAHWPAFKVFTAGDLAAIAAVATIVDPVPIGDWSEPRVDALLAQTEVILGHWGCPRIDAGVIDRAPRLGLIAYAAGTVKETIDEIVFGRDIRVTSGAVANAEPVAEFTLASILLATKDVLWRRDLWRDPAIGPQRQKSATPVGNWDKTVGIVGASIIGRRVIELLRAFPHVNVALYDPFVSADEAVALGVTKLDLDALCARADILSIHAPSLPTTHHMIGVPQLAALRTGATIINTARGALIDHDALTAELEAGRLYAMLDVTDPEPLPDDHPLRRLPNVFLTPHLAGSEGTELRRMAEVAVDEIRRWVAGDPPRNGITQEQLARLA